LNAEFDIIRRYFKKPTSSAILGIGDDAALVAPNSKTELAISTDTLVSGIHFFADTNPYQLGYKSLAVNLSDMAAMGAKPLWSMLSLTLPKILAAESNAWLSDFSKGFLDLAHYHQIELIGGDTTSGPLNINVQIIGEVAQGEALRRSGAMLGDEIWVSGHLGDAALALCHEKQQVTLEPEEIKQCLPALHTPTARVELGQRLIGLAHSAIDLSDGLMADLEHILAASNKAANVNLAAVPCSEIMQRYIHQSFAMDCLLTGGDDYELCFTAPKIKHKEIDCLSNELSLPLTCIGEISQGEGLIVRDAEGKAITLEKKGYDHFSS
jgi:thiamine-monophosphate kinase